MAVCERCGTENPEGFRYCGGCGTALAEHGSSRDARKVVTALFCDIAGSTALGENLDPEVLRDVVNRYLDEMRATIERHGGTVQKYAGDAVMAVFGIPRVHEDDALRAVRAAVEIRRRMLSVSQETSFDLRFRTGVNTGLVFTDEGKSLALGDAVNVAARLEQAAQPGEILIGGETLALVRDAVQAEPVAPLSLKGKSEPFLAYRLVSVDPDAPGRARRVDVPLIGREHELTVVRAAWDRALSQGDCRLMTIVGEAGVGKSRLVAEFLAGLDSDVTVLTGRCLPYGEGITFLPLIDALAPVSDRAANTLEHLGSGGAANREELFLEVRRLLEMLAVERPVVMHLDELQWAEPMLLDLLDHLTETSRAAPILLLCAARRELLEDRPEWGPQPADGARVILEPLVPAECELLLDALGDPLTPQIRHEVIRTSEGNPLFLQEMVELARERGAIVVPPTIQALLAARLERLIARERELLERGSIEGEIFHRATLRVLGPQQSDEEIGDRLASLVGKDLIRPHPAPSWGEDPFRFRHLLIRDAAYERLAKSSRAELHARFASWLEQAGTQLYELDEIAGWHLEQSVRYLEDLGRAVDPDLKRRAATHLHAAAQRAAARSDASAARSLLERALGLTEAGQSLHTVVGVDLAERLIEAGELAAADELLTAAEQDSTFPEQGAGLLNRLEWLVLAHPDQAAATVESMLPAMLEGLARSGDERRMAKAHMLAFWVHWAANQAVPAALESRLAAEHARNAGDSGLRSRALGWYIVTIIYGPLHVDDMERELDAIEREDPGLYLSACLALGRGEVERLHGRDELAHRLTRQAYDGFTALGMQPMAAGCAQELAQIELLKGEPVAAVELLRNCDAVLAELGERPQRATTQAMLARAYEQLASPESALAAVELAEQLSSPEDAINFALTYAVRARLALAAEDPSSAEGWARQALEQALRTDFITVHAEARLGLAHVLEVVDQPGAARSEAEEALTLFMAKGHRPGADAARSLLDRV